MTLLQNNAWPLVDAAGGRALPPWLRSNFQQRHVIADFTSNGTVTIVSGVRLCAGGAGPMGGRGGRVGGGLSADYAHHKRCFVGSTCLDPVIALVMGNLARVKSNSCVWDPCVGTAGLLLPATHHQTATGLAGGSDVDRKVLAGDGGRRDMATLFGSHNRALPELIQMDCEGGCFRPTSGGWLDAVVADPPYGRRERQTDELADGAVHIGSVTERVTAKLVNFALRHLVGNGFAVWLHPTDLPPASAAAGSDGIDWRAVVQTVTAELQQCIDKANAASTDGRDLVLVRVVALSDVFVEGASKGNRETVSDTGADRWCRTIAIAQMVDPAGPSIARLRIDDAAQRAEILGALTTHTPPAPGSARASDWREERLKAAEGHSAFDVWRAAWLGDAASIRMWWEAQSVDNRPSIDCLDDGGRTPLYFAAGYGQTEAVATLLDIGAHPDGADRYPPLGQAARFGRVDVCAALLEAGACPLREDDLGWTPVHLAAAYGHVEVLQRILDR